MCATFLYAQTSRVFEEYQKSYTNVYQNARLAPEEIASNYQGNNIPLEIRIDLYKKIFSSSDIKGWSTELQSIVLYQLIETDKNPQTEPAYKLMEQGYASFMARVQEILKKEFSFIEEWKAQYKKELEEKGLGDYDVELDGELLKKAIEEVYIKTFRDVKNPEQYKF